MPSLAQLRSLLPYAAKLLPLITGVAAPSSAGDPPQFESLNRHFGEIQTENRSLRSEVAGQSSQLTQLQAQLQGQYDRLAASQQSAVQQQAALAEALRRHAVLLKGLAAATLLLVLAIAVMCALLLARTH